MLDTPRPPGTATGGGVAPDPDGTVTATTSGAKRLTDLVASLSHAEVRGDADVSVSSVVYRSDEARAGSLFFCVPGTRVDGHDFAADALSRGAAVVVAERALPVEAAAQVIVPSVRAAMGPMSAEFYGRPAERMTMVGVTGTNGKTTTTYLLESAFRAAGLTPGVIGTTGVRIDGEPEPFPRTTPEAPDLHRLLTRMADRGVDAVAMEVSSHGLDQRRVGGIRYTCAVFTNLTQDHLDYHASIEDYFRAKAMLFTPEMAVRAAVNHDSPEGRRLLRPDLPTVTFGIGDGADLRATDVETSPTGIAFRAGELEVRSRLRGRFNVSNCLAALAASRQVGIDPADAARGIGELVGVPGRFEPVEAGQGFLVVVDYAHTPDSLENVLREARPLAVGRVICVFGCGGDRDRGKRPLMGEAATRLSDLTVVTSDNPRSEDPAAIIAEIEPGARRGGGWFEIEPDRRAAIHLAVGEARPGDVVVIAGKGHETGQEFADRTIPFDDRIVAAEEMRSLPRSDEGSR